MSGEHRLVQLLDPEAGRFVCRVEEPLLRVIDGCTTIYQLAQAALAAGEPLSRVAADRAGSRTLTYDEIDSASAGNALRFLPAIDHPEPARCLVSGTGLTHRRGVETRDAMHAEGAAKTDSTRMYELGLAGGRPQPGVVGVEPEWFYKGTGLGLRGHRDPLALPAHAEDGGEEPEIAGVYLVDADGVPRRLGMAVGNEFSDHQLERRNYLYLASSKLRTCALGPELVLDPDFSDVQGEVAIERSGRALWSSAVRTGDAAMCHSLANIEHHHFKHELHRRPGDVHVHFLGADAFSFSAGVTIEEGDEMRVSFAGFGRPLRNPLRAEPHSTTAVAVRSL